MPPKAIKLAEENAHLPQFIGISDLSKMLGCSIMTCRRWEANGMLPASIRLGTTQHRRWDLESIKAFLAAKGAK